MKGSFDSDSTSNNLYIMAWIYRAQNGDLMFSKTKPEKVYRFKFRNDQFHSDNEDVYCKQLSPEHIISISVYESQFESSEEQRLYSLEGGELLTKFSKKDCVFDYEYSTGFPVTFKPETVVALKSVIDLDTIIVENGLIEI